MLIKNDEYTSEQTVLVRSVMEKGASFLENWNLRYNFN